MKRGSEGGQPAAKRAKPAEPVGNRNVRERARVFEAGQVAQAVELLQNGQLEVAVVDAGVELPCPGEELVRYWNARVLPQYRKPVPTSWEDITYSTYRGLPGLANGMWHAYATSAHDAALDSPAVVALFNEITGTRVWQVRPNRLRFNAFDKDDGHKSAHIEGPHVLSERSGIAAIVCLTPGRTFTYYKGSNNDPRARQLFVELGGQASMFVQPTQAQLAPWQRTTIETTKPGQIILFADSVAHEISRLGQNSLSLFLSPYDPAKTVPETTFYAGLDRKAAVARKRASAPTACPPLPPRLMTDGQRRQHPREFDLLTRRETEIFGSLFHSGGAYWPSDKSTFFMMHMMAFGAFKEKLAPFCFNDHGEFNYEVITPELVAGWADFDPSYFQNLPLADVTPREVLQMKAKFTGIPPPAWPLVRYWTKDPRACSDAVCRRRGYTQKVPTSASCKLQAAAGAAVAASSGTPPAGNTTQPQQSHPKPLPPSESFMASSPAPARLAAFQAQLGSMVREQCSHYSSHLVEEELAKTNQGIARLYANMGPDALEGDDVAIHLHLVFHTSMVERRLLELSRTIEPSQP